MKAVVYHHYGSPDVLKYEELEKPIPRDDEVLIRVHAASVNQLDWRLMRGEPYIPMRLLFGLRKPRDPRLGRDVAGQVEAVGRKVTEFKPGDEVFGACRAAFAEYACAPKSSLVIKLKQVTFEQAASVPVAALTALQGLRDKGRIQPGQKVLINGASGGVGTFAVQIAKWLGADVTGVCGTRNVGMVQSIGADHVIDYRQEDFTKNEQRYDLFFDCVGNHSFSACRRVLNPKGIYIVVGAPQNGRWIGPVGRTLKALVLSPFVNWNLTTYVGKIRSKDLTILCELMDSGKVTPVIGKRYGLNEVPDAIRYLEAGHAQGKAVITVDNKNLQ